MKTLYAQGRALICALLSLPVTMLANGLDDFNDNSKDPAKWGSDSINGLGLLTERNARLEYTCTLGTIEDDDERAWIMTQMPANADWTIQINTFNGTVPTLPVQVNSLGIEIFTANGVNSLFAELYASLLGGGLARNGFFASLDQNGARIGAADSGGLPVTNGAVRMSYSSASKIITVHYDLDVSDGFQWVQYGTFGVAGAGGADGNSNWGLVSSDLMSVFVYGFSQAMTVNSGQMFLDNFTETGGVVATGPPPTLTPTGLFHFLFPTNNPALTAIVDVTGNYHGVTPTHFHRNYNIDAAEDDSGKLSIMGTMDGILDNKGNSQVSTNVGSVKTMNDQPVGQLNGNFNGTRDGVNVNFNGSGTFPAKLVDVGGGQMGVMGTSSYNSQIGNMHFNENNLPLAIAAPPGSTSNLKKAWSFDVDLHQKMKPHGKSDTFATGQIILPSGDLIAFKEKKADYKADKGYFEEIHFDEATNMTHNPPGKADKVKIKLRRVSFVRQGNAWRPTGGTIDYEFFGQKGNGNLIDFLP